MDKDIFEYLRVLGLSDIEINYIEDNNDNIVYANLNHVKKIINFLQELELNINEIKKILKINVYMITENFQRINKLNFIYYEQLNFNKLEIKNLLIENPEIYTISPLELQKIIDYLKDKNYDNEIIKKLIIKNPQIINMKFKNFEKTIRFN